MEKLKHSKTGIYEGNLIIIMIRWINRNALLEKNFPAHEKHLNILANSFSMISGFLCCFSSFYRCASNYCEGSLLTQVLRFGRHQSGDFPIFRFAKWKNTANFPFIKQNKLMTFLTTKFLSRFVISAFFVKTWKIAQLTTQNQQLLDK